MSDAGGLIDPGYYEAQRRNISSEFAAQMAANTYGRFLAQQRGQRDINDMQRGFKQGFGGYSAQFGQRGVGGGGIQSGVMQRSMSNYLADYQRNYARANQDLTSQLQQFDMTGMQLQAQRQSALQDLRMQKAREIAFAAQNIEALRQVLGGL